MKRFLILYLSALLLSLTGCGAENAADEKNFQFEYQDITIAIAAEAAPVIEALGPPKSCTEETSCAFDGLDKTYEYGSFYLTTYPDEDVERIARIWFVDDSVSTAEGIRIGSTRAEVETIYGAFSDICVQTRHDSKLTILFENNVVSSIQYELILK